MAVFQRACRLAMSSMRACSGSSTTNHLGEGEVCGGVQFSCEDALQGEGEGKFRHKLTWLPSPGVRAASRKAALLRVADDDAVSGATG